MRRSLLCLASFLVLVGCSEDEDAKNAQPVDSGTADTNVVDATTDTGTDSSAPSDSAMDSAADSEMDSASEATSDSSADVSDAPMSCVADAGADADAAPLCPIGKWMDYESGSCRACPSAAMTCATIDPSVVNYSTTTRRLTLNVQVGSVQLVSGTVKVSYTDGSCTSTGPGSGAIVSTADLPIEVNGDKIYVDLSAVGIASVRPCGTFTLDAVDACCTTHHVMFDVFFDDASAIPSVSCPVASDSGVDASAGG